MAEENKGRSPGAKAPSYVRAVNEIETRASRFTARHMLVSDLAYVLTAADLGLTPEDTAQVLLKGVLANLDGLASRDFSVPPGDIVAQREAWMREQAGPQHAAWLHLGRNRGESLRNYLPRLYFRQTLHEARQEVGAMIRILLDRAEPLMEALTPNYHHLQHSGFATVGEYLMSWVPRMFDHIDRLEEIDRRLDYGPSFLGSRSEVRALFDTVARRLGFTRRAQLRRDGIWMNTQFSEPFFGLTALAVDLARLAQDLRIWMTPEFDLFAPAGHHTGGSSALPHARVPFGFQSVIGGAILAANRLSGEMSAAAGSPSEGSEAIYQSGTLYQAAWDIVAFTRYMAEVIRDGEFNLEEMRRKAVLDYAGSSEAHDMLVYEHGVPFRVGHAVLGRMARAHMAGEPIPDLNAALKAETGRDFDLDTGAVMDVVLGRTLMPTTFDFAGIRALWQDYDRQARAIAGQVQGAGIVAEAAAAIIEEARARAAR